MNRKILIPLIVVIIISMGDDAYGRRYRMDATDINSQGENHDAVGLYQLNQNETMELTLFNDDDHVIISGILVEVIRKFDNGSWEIDKLSGPDDETLKIHPGGEDNLRYGNPDKRRKELGLEIVTYHNQSLSDDKQEDVKISFSFKVFDEDGNVIFEEKRFRDDNDVNYPLIILCCSVPIFVIAVLLILTIRLIRIKKN
jgi:hypothetical protein